LDIEKGAYNNTPIGHP